MYNRPLDLPVPFLDLNDPEAVASFILATFSLEAYHG